MPGRKSLMRIAAGAVIGLVGWVVYRAYQGSGYSASGSGDDAGSWGGGWGLVPAAYAVADDVRGAFLSGVNDNLTPSYALLAFLKGYENPSNKGFNKSTGRWYAYDDGYGFLTIGYGHKIKPFEDYSSGLTTQEVEALFAIDVTDHAAPVYKGVKVPLSQQQFDALVSLVFNIGGTNFAGSSLLKRLNIGDYGAAGNSFMDFVKARNAVTRKLEFSNGLYNRRYSETRIWFHGIYERYYGR